MQSIVQAETPHRLDVLEGERCQEVPDLGDFICHIVLAEDVSLDDTGLLGLDHVADALGQDSIAVVRAAISGEEANEALPSCQSTQPRRRWWAVGLTEKAGIVRISRRKAKPSIDNKQIHTITTSQLESGRHRTVMLFIDSELSPIPGAVRSDLIHEPCGDPHRGAMELPLSIGRCRTVMNRGPESIPSLVLSFIRSFHTKFPKILCTKTPDSAAFENPF